MSGKILILDDDPYLLEPLVELVTNLGYETFSSTDPLKGLDLVEKTSPSVVITDLKMPVLDGIEILKRVRAINPNTQVVMISGQGTIGEAVASMKMGAYDFISKPFKVSEIENVVAHANEKFMLLEENLRLRETVRRSRIPNFSQGKNPEFRELLESAAQAAVSQATVLVLGESGTGKEILAGYIVAHSKRADKPFVAINCAAIAESLIESELFGHKKGAFTGAHQDRPGRFREAHGGTIFLDEIGELPLNMQAKLLRVLQEGEVTPVGGTSQKVDVRIIAATNKNLGQLAKAGLFREDLFYRLNVITLVIPPLRQRLEDLPGYVAFFLAKHCKKNDRQTLSITKEALRVLESYPWPGNMRELENAIERAVILETTNEITVKSLPATLTEKGTDRAEVNFQRGMKLEDIELLVIQTVLRYNHGDRAKSAEELGIGVRTLYRKVMELQARETDSSPLE